MNMEHHEPPGDKRVIIEIAGVDLNFQAFELDTLMPTGGKLAKVADSIPTSALTSSSGATTAISKNSANRKRPT